MEREDYKLWKFFNEDHGLILTDGEITDIIREVEKWQTVKNEDTKREKLIKSDGYWRAKIENLLYYKNYKGKNRRELLISDILKLKKDILKSDDSVQVCPECKVGKVKKVTFTHYCEDCGSPI